jgi:hypothetical protein
MLLFVDRNRIPDDLIKGLEQLSVEYPIVFTHEENSFNLLFAHEEGEFGLKVSYSARDIIVHYARRSDAFRALGRILAFAESPVMLEEHTPIESLGFMIDCSRGAVLTVETAKLFLRRLALMGYQVFMLYMEDVYEIPDQPFFGYLRGRYSIAELKEIDNYAFSLGIEVIPCIQTLGHLEQILQWEAYADIRDTQFTLMVGEEKTYQLIEQIFETTCACFHSKRIHIGFDEVRMLGTGAYKGRFGERECLDLMGEHLERVYSICRKHGVQPMMWSDCLFRRGKDKSKDYFDLNAKPPEELLRKIPDDIQMVHWDYWHQDEQCYADYIDLHRKYGKEPIFAPGAITSCRFWCALEHCLRTIVPSVNACRKKNVRELLLTSWGDDGAEADCHSTLPAAYLMAELAYGYTADDMERLNNGFNAICGVPFEAYLLASRIDILPSMASSPYQNANCAKWLLWDDPLLGICEPYHKDEKLTGYYANLSTQLASLISDTIGGSRLRFPQQIATVLTLKADLRKNLVNSYKQRNLSALSEILFEELNPLIEEVDNLWRIHREIWFETYKPFGWEKIERRYGGLLLRLKTLRERLEALISGTISEIPEFDTELEKFVSKPVCEFFSPLLLKYYRRFVSPNTESA